MNNMFEQLEYTTSLPGAEIPAVEILRAMEAASRLHTDRLGIGRAHILEKYGAVWMIARCSLRLDSLFDPSVPLTVRTWHRGLFRGTVLRDYELIQRGNVIGEAVQTWVVVDTVRRTIVRMDRLPELMNVPHPDIVKADRPQKLTPPPTLAEVEPIIAGPDTLDDNGHINNTNYISLAFRRLEIPIRDIKTLELNYHRECFAGVPLPCCVYQDENSAFMRLHTPEGATAFDLYTTY